MAIIKRDILDLNVLDNEKLKALGYKENIYYCGNHQLQWLWTRMANYYKKLGIPVPFNPACFKHDLLYSKRPTKKERKMVDRVFLYDMLKILEEKKKTNTKIKSYYLRLKFRAILYYNIVNFFTSIRK